MRRTLIERREALPARWRSRADAQIVARLVALLDALLDAPLGAPIDAPNAAPNAAPIAAPIDAQPVPHPVRRVGVFRPHRSEPDLEALYRHLRRRGVELALPRVVGRARPLEFGRWLEGGELVPEVFGIEVPSPFEPVLPDALVVPCVGFDRRGFRLGYGGGYYDMTLAARPVPVFGAAYGCCEIADFVAEPHDRPLTSVCTEAGCTALGTTPGTAPRTAPGTAA